MKLKFNWASSVLPGSLTTHPHNARRTEVDLFDFQGSLHWEFLGGHGECTLFQESWLSVLFKNMLTTSCTHFFLGSRQSCRLSLSFTMISELAQRGPLSITFSSLINLGWKGVVWILIHWHRSSETNFVTTIPVESKTQKRTKIDPTGSANDSLLSARSSGDLSSESIADTEVRYLPIALDLSFSLC